MNGNRCWRFTEGEEESVWRRGQGESESDKDSDSSLLFLTRLLSWYIIKNRRPNCYVVWPDGSGRCFDARLAETNTPTSTGSGQSWREYGGSKSRA